MLIFVKNLGNKIYIYSLQDSFDVILHKLDNVNKQKKKRMESYAKLKDFEDYLIFRELMDLIVYQELPWRKKLIMPCFMGRI